MLLVLNKEPTTRRLKQAIIQTEEAGNDKEEDEIFLLFICLVASSTYFISCVYDMIGRGLCL